MALSRLGAAEFAGEGTSIMVGFPRQTGYPDARQAGAGHELLPESEPESCLQERCWLRGRRFKNLPSDFECRIRTADGNHLDDWLDRFVDAQTLDEVFSAEQGH